MWNVIFCAEPKDASYNGKFGLLAVLEEAEAIEQEIRRGS